MNYPKGGEGTLLPASHKRGGGTEQKSGLLSCRRNVPSNRHARKYQHLNFSEQKVSTTPQTKSTRRHLKLLAEIFG